MSRPRFLADHDLNEHIVTGVLRQEPVMGFLRVRDLGMNGPMRKSWTTPTANDCSLCPTTSTPCPRRHMLALPPTGRFRVCSWFPNQRRWVW